MPKARAPTPRRRTILKLLAGSIAGARLSGLGSRFAAAAVPPLAGGDSVMSLEFDDDLRNRLHAALKDYKETFKAQTAEAVTA